MMIQWFRALFGRRIEQRSGVPPRDPALASWFAAPVAAGVTVTEETAMRFTAVFACVKILAESVASLPAIVYRRLPAGGKVRAVDHPLYTILHDLPNDTQTGYEFKELLQGHLALCGNGYARIRRAPDGRVVGLDPLDPRYVRPFRLENGRHAYEIAAHRGIPQSVMFAGEGEILHVRAFSSDGLVGLSPIAQAREAVGLGLAAEEFGSRFFGNGARPGGILEHPGRLSDLAAKRLKDSWNEMHRGPSNAHRVAILEEGMKWHQIGISNEDAQFLELRRFQVAEIARIFRVPLVMLQETEKSTSWGSGIEQFMLGFVVHTLRPWLVRWEQALMRDLLTPSERRDLVIEFLLDGLLRGDIVSRYNAYATARQWGWMSVNEIRERENMNPVVGGDVYLQPLNMQSTGVSNAVSGTS